MFVLASADWEKLCQKHVATGTHSTVGLSESRPVWAGGSCADKGVLPSFIVPSSTISGSGVASLADATATLLSLLLQSHGPLLRALCDHSSANARRGLQASIGELKNSPFTRQRSQQTKLRFALSKNVNT